MTLEISEFDEQKKIENDSTLLNRFPVKSAKDLIYSDFFYEFMLQNKPCLIHELMNDWPATKLLTNEKNEPNVEFFDSLENVNVPVADCSAKYFNSQEKISMTLKEYVSFWTSRDERNDAKKALSKTHLR